MITPLTDEVVDVEHSPEAEALWQKYGEPPWARVTWRHDEHRGHRHNFWEGLEDVDCTGADLDGATLVGGRLARLRAARSRWNGANLASSSIEDVDYSGASSARASAGRSWPGRALPGAQASGLRLDHARIDACDFAGADLRTATFEDAVVTDSSFEGADLTCHDHGFHLGRTRRARFVRCNFRADIDARELVDVVMEDCATEGMRGTPACLGG